MKKLNSTGRSFVMAISMCVVFLFLGASATAQNWVTPDEAVLLLKAEIETLEQAFQNAPTTEAKLEIAFRHKYYSTIMEDLLNYGTEVPEAVIGNRPENKPTLHSSGMIAFSSDDENFKQDAQTLVDDATALLTE